jgi:hypothetical protein
LVEGDPLFGQSGTGHRHLAVKVLQLITVSPRTVKEKAAGVEGVRIEGVEVVPEDESLQFRMVGTRRVVESGLPITRYVVNSWSPLVDA